MVGIGVCSDNYMSAQGDPHLEKCSPLPTFKQISERCSYDLHSCTILSKVSHVLVLTTHPHIENFVSPKLILILPVSLSFLFALPETSSTMMGRNNIGLHLCSHYNFKGKDSKVASVMSTVYICQILLIMSRNFCLFYSLLNVVGFNHRVVGFLPNVFFTSIEQLV